MMRKILFGFLLSLCCVSVLAAQAPVAMLQQTTGQMLSALKQSHNRSGDALYPIINRILLPHIELNTMSRMVVGRYWGTATPAQQQEFKKQFTHYVTQTYSTALAQYKNEKVSYFPIRGGITGNRVQVNSQIEQSNGQTINVNYQLMLSGGQWKVYDFSVEGVGMVQSYRSQFADILSSQGLPGLLQRLQAKNSGHVLR